MNEFSEGQSSGFEEEIRLWQPQASLREVDPYFAALSRGFLQSRPERWFPGMGAEWIPFAHSCGVELRVQRVMTQLVLPRMVKGTVFSGTLSSGECRCVIDGDAEQVLYDLFLPTLSSASRRIVLDYFARRLFSTLAHCWSGADSSQTYSHSQQYDESVGEMLQAGGGVVQVEVLVNGRPVRVWLVLAKPIVSQLDGLWRRQLRSVSSLGPGAHELRFELAQIAVLPAMLGEYTQPGTAIDLETPVTDTGVLRVGNTPWLSTRLCRVRDTFAFETLPTGVVNREIPSGSIRVSIQFPSFSLQGGDVAEITQVGSVLVSPLKITDRAEMVINQERVAEVEVQEYQGRFAVTVL